MANYYTQLRKIYRSDTDVVLMHTNDPVSYRAILLTVVEMTVSMVMVYM